MLVAMPRQRRAERSPESQSADLGQQAVKTQPGVVLDMPCLFVHESAVGGLPKRAFDIAVAALSAPVWLLAIAALAAFARWRKHRRPVFSAQPRIGYGGRAFTSWRLNWTAKTEGAPPLPGSVESLLPAPEASLTSGALIERLPEMWSVLRGDMSLVGPRPLTSEAFGALGWSRKYYASARPGLIGANDAGSATLSYKYYLMDWSFGLDMRTIECAVKPLAQRVRDAVLRRERPQTHEDGRDETRAA